MVWCEICGENNSCCKIKLNNVILKVCQNCQKYGTKIEEKIIPHKEIKTKNSSESEEVLVEDYASKIKKARILSGLTQEEFANKLNINLSVLKMAESGKRLSIPIAKKIEKLINIKLVEKIGY
ncbi:MAG: multiprotein-bridging factor 1 family protein [Candidatus Nanoarchaeia archaeon]